jgi:PPOX class probable F420-dependent enzyme
MLPESHLDLLDEPVPATLSTVGPGGYPQVTTLWVYREGERIVTSLWRGRQKFRNLERAPRASLFVLDPANQFRSIEVRGDVELADDPEAATLVTLLGHYGTDLEHFSGPTTDRVRVVLTPTRVVTLG